MIIPFKYLVQMLIQFIVLQHPKSSNIVKTFSWYWEYSISKRIYSTVMVFNTIHIIHTLLWANMLVIPPPNKKNLRKNVWKGGGLILQTSLQCKKKNPWNPYYIKWRHLISLSFKKIYIYTHAYMQKWHLRGIVHLLQLN